MSSSLEFQSPYEAYRWAEELFGLKKYAEAATVLQRVVDEVAGSEGVDPGEAGLASARELLARSYFHSAQLGRAVAVAREVLERDPTDTYMTMLLARALERSSRSDEAAAARRVLDALDPPP